MIFDIVKPYKDDPTRTFFKTISTFNAHATDNAWELFWLLDVTAHRNVPLIHDFNGFKNCVSILNQPAPYL